MPVIRSSAELRNSYSDISNLCHSYREPVYITKNGKGDLAVMSIELFEEMEARHRLYEDILVGLEDVQEGRTRPLSEALASIRSRRK